MLTLNPFMDESFRRSQRSFPPSAWPLQTAATEMELSLVEGAALPKNGVEVKIPSMKAFGQRDARHLDASAQLESAHSVPLIAPVCDEYAMLLSFILHGDRRKHKIAIPILKEQSTFFLCERMTLCGDR